ncbi:MAG: hypothetical protein ABIE22_03470 [archaeon]
MIETPTLTKGRIEAAKKYQGHPVVKEFRRMRNYLCAAEEAYDILEEEELKERVIEATGMVIAENLKSVEISNMGEEDIISIWSWVCNESSGIVPALRHRLSSIIPAVYAIRGMEYSDWGFVPIQVAQTNTLPEECLQDTVNACRFYSKLQEVYQSIDEIEFYTKGIRGGFTALGDLTKKAYREDDKEALAEIGRLEQWSSEHEDDLLGTIEENFNNGLGGLIGYIKRHYIEKIEDSTSSQE